MKLYEVLEGGSQFAINEFTGAVVGQDRDGYVSELIKSDLDDPANICRLLFDEEAIENGWSPIHRDAVIEKAKETPGGVSRVYRML